jgi:hypothetical protein
VELRNEFLDLRNDIVTLSYHVWADVDCDAKRYVICEQRGESAFEAYRVQEVSA